MKRIQHFIFLFLISFFSSAMSRADDALWIDVRSVVEHKLDHIEGDPRINHSDIVNDIAALSADKNTEIRLYCRSGGRAGKAQAALQAAGYKNVKNVGSIENARKLRGLEK